tara:strand:+ start:662 stop:1108 length:447 start_codon:yes stop_codon:yes gene_type:complete
MKNAIKTKSDYVTNPKVTINLNMPKAFIKDYLNKRNQKRIALKDFGDSSHSIKYQFESMVAQAIATRFRIGFDSSGNQKDSKAEIRKVWKLLKKQCPTFTLSFKGQKQVLVRVKSMPKFSESKARTLLTKKQVESCMYQTDFIEVQDE